MCLPLDTQVDQASSDEPCSQLLQLPNAARDLVLQQLDQCSLFSLAACCSSLHHAVLANIRQITVACSTAEAFSTFEPWLQKHSSSLVNLKECAVIADWSNLTQRERRWPMYSLPCPQLRNVHLKGSYLSVRRVPAAGYPGFLQDCTGLTALRLEGLDVDATCKVVAAAIEALPELQYLELRGTAAEVATPEWYLDTAWREYSSCENSRRAMFAQLQLPVQLSHLSLASRCSSTSDWTKTVDRLPELTALKHLELNGLPPDGVSGSLPSHLVHLTHLWVRYAGAVSNVAQQFQDLSTFTALRELSVGMTNLAAGALSGIEHLPQLTRLAVRLASPVLQFSTASTSSWGHLTALQSLDLQLCTVQPEALSCLTQLQELALHDLSRQQGPLEELLGALSQLLLLTNLYLAPMSEFAAGRNADIPGVQAPMPIEAGLAASAAAFTAITASTNPSRLQLRMPMIVAPQGCTLFGTPDAVHPKLRRIQITWYGVPGALPLSEQQLKELCSCCPAVEILMFHLAGAPSPTALLPLLQLSELTQLRVLTPAGICRYSTTVLVPESELLMQGALPTSAAVLHVAAQLTRLRNLVLTGLPRLQDPVLLQLTALTALRRLSISGMQPLVTENGPTWSLCLLMAMRQLLGCFLLGAAYFWGADTLNCATDEGVANSSTMSLRTVHFPFNVLSPPHHQRVNTRDGKQKYRFAGALTHPLCLQCIMDSHGPPKAPTCLI